MVKMYTKSERGTGLKFKIETVNTVRRFTPYTPVKYIPNPKRPGSKSFDRYNQYIGAATVGEAVHCGAKVADLLWELERGIYKVLPAPKRPLKLRGMTAKDVEAVTEKLATIQGPRALAMSLDDPRAAQELAREEAWQKSKLKLCTEWSKKLGVELETETREDLLEDGCYETTDIRNGRLVADALALATLKAAAKAGGQVSDADVTMALRLWGFAQNGGRLNVLPEGRKWVYSDTLGGIKRRTGGYGVTPPTRRYPNVARLLNQWLRDNRPPGLTSDFACTSININANYAGRTHRDGNNEGPSAIRAFGDFRGGELWYWHEDRREEKPEALLRKDAKKLNIKKRTEIFDGNRAHAVGTFTGERISVVFFSCRKYGRVGLKNIAWLKSKCGFNWPTEKVLAALKKEASKAR